MNLSRADIAQRADALTTGLVDHERIALGVRLIETARRPDSWAAVTMAAQLIREHADALLMDSLRTAEAHETPAIAATTHEQSGDRRSGGSCRAGEARSRVPSALRGAWSAIVEWDARFSESWAGIILGGLCMFGTGIGLVIIAGVLQ